MDDHLIICSHRRSGTHLAIDAIINNFSVFKDIRRIKNRNLDHLSEHIPLSKTTLSDLQRELSEQHSILKSHAHSNLESFFQGSNEMRDLVRSLFERSKIIYVYRDGRDVLVSLYHYKKTYDSKTAGQSFQEFIRERNEFDETTYNEDMNRVAYWSYHVRSWLNQSDCLYISFEELINRYEETLDEISGYLGEPLNEEVVDVRLKPDSNYGWLTKMKETLLPAGIRRTSVKHRKGEIGEWVDYFSDTDEQFFKENSGNLLQELGYK